MAAPIAVKSQCVLLFATFFSYYETQQLILGTGTAIWWVTKPHCLNSNIYSYLETSGGQSSNLYLIVVHLVNTNVCREIG
jgi:hypothetical protein